MKSLLFFLGVLRSGFQERGPAEEENPVNIQLRWNPAIPGESVTLLTIPAVIYDALYELMK